MQCEEDGEEVYEVTEHMKVMNTFDATAVVVGMLVTLCHLYNTNKWVQKYCQQHVFNWPSCNHRVHYYIKQLYCIRSALF